MRKSLERRERVWRQFAAYAAIVCATLIVYWPALHGSFLWDDDAHVTRVGLRSLHGLYRIWFDPGATQQYYPLLHSMFWIEDALWGDAVLGYHLTNVLLHALAACLLAKVARRLAIRGAWLAGMLFALHPVCVEAVAWISEEKSTLSGVFYFAAALAYLTFDESRRPTRYILALALFVCALLSKTVTATLPATLLVILWWKRGRLEAKRDVAPLVPFFAFGIGAGLFTAWMERTHIGATGPDFDLSLLQRVLLAGRAMCFYAAKILVPVHLTFFYPRWTIDASALWQWLPLIAVVAACVACAFLSRRTRAPLATLLVFGCALFPALGFFNVYPFRYSYVADHFAYLAVPALMVPIAIVLAQRPWRMAYGLALAAVFAVLTCVQSADYASAETLYRAMLARNPGAWLAHNNLGNEILSANPTEAVAHFREAIRLNPDFWEAHLSLGNAMLQSGRTGEALTEYETAERLAPNSERTQTNLGNALLQLGRVGEATAHLQRALQIDPENAEAHTDLGNAWLQTGRTADAIAEYQRALAGNPDLAEAHNSLGRAYAMSGRMPDAIAEFDAAIRIRPEYPSAHNNLGNALLQYPNRLQDAIAEYRRAIELNPDFAAAHYNLATALVRAGARTQADAEFAAAARLSARQPTR